MDATSSVAPGGRGSDGGGDRVRLYKYPVVFNKKAAMAATRSELGRLWYTKADPARKEALQLTDATGETHIVVALDYGTLRRAAGGAVRREAVVDASTGSVVAAKMYCSLAFAQLAELIDYVRLSASHGPTCLNMFEEYNVSRPRRVGFDLDFEIGHELSATGERDHEQRAATLWPQDYREVVANRELFLQRTLVERVLPALNGLSGARLTTRDLYLLDSSSSEKLSFHVVTPLVLESAEDRGLFSRWMEASFKNGSGALSPILDVSVYSTCGNMRLPLNRKPAKPGSASERPWLRPVSRVGELDFAATHDDATPTDPHDYTLSLLQQHAWTWVSREHTSISDRLTAWAESQPHRAVPRPPSGVAPKKRKSGACNTLADRLEPNVLAAVAELGFDPTCCEGVSDAGNQVRFRYRGQCPFCKADVHGSNFALWVCDDRLYVTSYSNSHKGEAPATLMLAMEPDDAAFPTHLPLSAAFYAEGLGRLDGAQPNWRLQHVHYTFKSREHEFLALFEVRDRHFNAVHADGFKRVLGITARCEVVLGKKEFPAGDFSRYEWRNVTYKFFRQFKSWWDSQPARSLVPPPGADGVYSLPCCGDLKCKCWRVKAGDDEGRPTKKAKQCATITGAPWMHLHELRAHGVGGPNL